MEPDRETLQIEVVAENADRSGVYFTVLDLPAMGGRIQDALQRLRSTATPERPFDVSIRESPKLPELAGITLIAPTLPELNFFARRLAFMPDEDILLLKGVFLQRLEAGRYENGIPMKELINLTYGLDTVMIASNVGDDEALGRFVVENELNEDVNAIPESSLYLLDQAQIGRLQRKNDGGVFVDGCYVVAGEYELAEIYDGTHLPETKEEPEDAVFRLLVAQTPMDDPEETVGSAEWISLPIPPEKAAQIAHAHNEMCMEDCVYYDMDSAIPQIDDQVYNSMDHFARLNQIAMQYQAMSEPEQIKYKAVLEAEAHLTMEKALELAAHLPEYEFTPLPCDEADFFKEYLSHHLDTRMDRRWLSTIATQAEGARLLQKLGATQTEYGILSAPGHSLYELVPYGEPSRELSAQALTDEKLEVVEVLGQTALFTNGRVTEQELPDGLYRYDLREGENLAFATIERNVSANHAGTILTKAPLDFGGQEYLVFDEDTSPNFLGYDLTPEEFLQTDFTQTDAQEEDSAPQMGGIQ